MENILVSQCESKGDGGVVSVSDINIQATDSSFTGNKAAGKGGAIYINCDFIHDSLLEFQLAGNIFSDNQADVGGAVMH
jgi:predicted outer membrane repeat protein